MYVSFATFGIYRDGGFPGRAELLQTLISPDEPANAVSNATLLDPRELFAPACYHRPAFAFACDSEAFATAITGGCETINRHYVTSPGVTMATLQAARITHGVVSTASDAGAAPLYEADPRVGRHPVADFPADDASMSVPPTADETLPEPANGALLWLGGADGTAEHVWLTDHLPRLVAVAESGAAATLSVLIEAGMPAVDVQRRNSIAAVLGGMPHRVVVIDPARSYAVDRLLVVSPASQPPFLKSPHALRHLRDRIASSIGALPAPVARKYYAYDSAAAGLPADDNQQALLAYLRGEGFRIVDLALCSFKERAGLFGDAELVVAPMQPALAGTLFCKPGTALVYLAAEGEPDPFYWDLAACCGHRYAVCYGRASAPGGFDIALPVLADALAQQWTSMIQG